MRNYRIKAWDWTLFSLDCVLALPPFVTWPAELPTWPAVTGACHTAVLFWLRPPGPYIQMLSSTDNAEDWKSLKRSLNSTMCSRISIFIWSEVCFSYFFFCCFVSRFLSLDSHVSWLLLLFILFPHISFSLPDSLPELFTFEKSFHRKATKCSGGVSVKCSVLLDRKSRKFLNPDEMF